MSGELLPGAVVTGLDECSHVAGLNISKETQMAQGTVKWFDDAKGFGFIARESGADVFVHHSGIEGAGFRSLSENQVVEFDLGPSRKGGEQATNVRVVG